MFSRRPVLVYGSGDDCSLLTDLIRTSEWFGCVPVVGGRDGIMQVYSAETNLFVSLVCLFQMANVENISAAIWSSATQLVTRTIVPEEGWSLSNLL